MGFMEELSAIIVPVQANVLLTVANTNGG
jgi:hypothetical protein